MGFNEAQQKAIDTLDKSLLVSAAAGSGKTAVLVERIIKIILDEEVDIDRILVLTFTKAAASEMKLKLVKAIKKRIKEDKEAAPRLREQLKKINGAYISTFHNFANRVMKEFFQDVDVDPAAKPCEETKQALLLERAADEMFDYFFENDYYLADKKFPQLPEDDEYNVSGIGFRDFLKMYCDLKDEKNLKANLIAVYGNLRNIPEYLPWAWSKARELDVDPDNTEKSEIMRQTAEIVRQDLEESLKCEKEFEEIMHRYNCPMFADSLSLDRGTLRGIKDSFDANGLNRAFFDFLATYKPEWQNYPRKKVEPLPDNDTVSAPLRKKYKEPITKIRNKYKAPEIYQRLDEMRETARYTAYCIKMIAELEERYNAVKRERRLIDFSDMEHNALKVLRNPRNAETLRDRFEFIFVDEYQDTSNIQEAILKSIEGSRNVFKVGDIKQSIYGFRSSDPYIFENTKIEYSDPANGEVINLKLNYRSSKPTIEYINAIFREIMDGYDEDAALEYGRSNEEPMEMKPDVYLFSESDPAAATRDETEDGGQEVNEGEQPENDEQKPEDTEAEAQHVAQIVSDIIGKDFYDSKQGIVRKAEKKDIVILLKTVKGKGFFYSKAMEERGIDAHLKDSEDYFDEVEVGDILSLLQAIDNMQRDVPLIAALRSEVFAFTPRELALIRVIAKEHIADRKDDGKRICSSFYSAFKYCVDRAEDDAESDDASEEYRALFRKSKAAFDTLKRWKTLSARMPLDEYIWYVLTDSKYYYYAGAMPRGMQRQANLMSIVDKAHDFSESSIVSAHDFLQYLQRLKNSDVKVPTASIHGQDDDVVRIMSIHKSKGLEFPFVIVAGMGRGVAGRKSGTGRLSMNHNVGIGIDYYDKDTNAYCKTIAGTLIADRKRNDDAKEVTRTLYVACTRAREKLILVGTVKDANEFFNSKKTDDSYYEMMKDVLKTEQNETEHDDTEHNETKLNDLIQRYLYDLPAIEKKDIKRIDTFEEPDPLVYEEVKRRLDYDINEGLALSVKSKYSVSELNDRENEAAASTAEEQVRSSKKNQLFRIGDVKKAEFGDSPSKIKGTDVGTAYHRILEQIDFARAVDEAGRCDDTYVSETAISLRDAGVIGKDVFEKIRIDRIENFLTSDVGLRAAAATRAGRCSKEKSFTLCLGETDKANIGLADDPGNHTILVQGVIDCMFEEDDGIVLIDYKSNVGDGEEPDEGIKKKYLGQLRLYSQAVKCGKNRPLKEIYLYLISYGRFVRVTEEDFRKL